MPFIYPITDINSVIRARAPVISSALFSHEISRCTLRDDERHRSWIKKEMPGPAVAKRELLAQEFFRLLIPHQPETRLAINERLKTYYILSEEVPEYRPLPENSAEKFGNGRYQGLGQIMLCSMFSQETDLKNGNLGLDKHRRVIKIDGDWCFSSCTNKLGGQIYKLTPKSIDVLPYHQKDFYAYNWLDVTCENKKKEQSNIVNQALSQNLQFRAEVNQAMLKICLLPDAFINKFVDAYMPEGARFATLIKTRREELRLSALQNPSFITYLNTDQAAVDAQSILAQMQQFKVCGKQLMSDDVPDVHKMIMKLLKDSAQSTPLLTYAQSIAEATASAAEDTAKKELLAAEKVMKIFTVAIFEKAKAEKTPDLKIQELALALVQTKETAVKAQEKAVEARKEATEIAKRAAELAGASTSEETAKPETSLKTEGKDFGLFKKLFEEAEAKRAAELAEATASAAEETAKKELLAAEKAIETLLRAKAEKTGDLVRLTNRVREQRDIALKALETAKNAREKAIQKPGMVTINTREYRETYKAGQHAMENEQLDPVVKDVGKKQTGLSN